MKRFIVVYTDQYGAEKSGYVKALTAKLAKKAATAKYGNSAKLI